jgi:hypothetical protein
MRVVDKCRVPSVQHRDEADAGAEMLGIGRDREQGLGRGLEQAILDHGLVLVSDVAERGRQREYDVKVRYWQQLGLAFCEPFLGGGTLATPASSALKVIVSKHKDSRYVSGRSLHWIKSKNPNAPAVKREAKIDWGR